MDNIAFIVLAAIASGFGGYFGAYLKKKGENLATHEDLDKLVQQMTATTEATKAIEARISDQIWNRQRQWEFKRELLTQLIRSMSNVDNSLLELHAVYSSPVPPVQEIVTIRLGERRDQSRKWNALNLELDSARAIASLVVGKELLNAIWAYTYAVRLAGKSTVGGYTEDFLSKQKTVSELHNSVLIAAQKELGLEVSDFLATYHPETQGQTGRSPSSAAGDHNQ
jgi:hypothetical protein